MRAPGLQPLGLVLAGLLALVSGCRGAGVAPDWEAASLGEQLVPEGHQVYLRRARASLERRDYREVRAFLLGTLYKEPDCVVAALLGQDADLAQGNVGSIGLFDPWKIVSTVAWIKARESGRGLDFLLAGRSDEDSIASMNMLDQIIVAEPRNPAHIRAWAHYGLAFRLLESGELAAAERNLAAALKEQPGHLLARRLEIRLKDASDDRAGPEQLLAYWIDQAIEAPEVPSTLWYDAVVDLAILRMQRNDGKAALAALQSLDYVRGATPEESPGSPSNAWGGALMSTSIRAGLVRAGALASIGQADEALDQTAAVLLAAKQAGIALPIAEMQRARLFERWLLEPEKAAEAWAAALDIIATEVQTGGAPGQEFDDLLRFVQAQVRLERLRGEGYGREPGASNP